MRILWLAPLLVGSVLLLATLLRPPAWLNRDDRTAVAIALWWALATASVTAALR